MRSFPRTEQTDKLREIFQICGYEIRLVGGAVRDIVLGHEPKDLDFCTTATPDKMVEIGYQFDIPVIETGLQHGTVTFVIDHVPFEVTTLRIDVETDGRHAEVQFTTSFEQDAARRDLTINAMSMDFDGNIYDPFGGLTDLVTPIRVRFVGDIKDRIQEDYLRILRYFRFAARYNAEMAHGDLYEISQLASGLKQISKERIWAEFKKLIMYPDAKNALDAMYRANVLCHIDLEDEDKVVDIPLNGFTGDDYAARMASILYYWTNEQVAEFVQTWKMSREEQDKIRWLHLWNNDTLIRQQLEDTLVYGTPTDYVKSLCSMQGPTGIQAWNDWFANWTVPEFPVRGQDLLNAGMKPGKDVGAKLATMKNRWMASRFQLTKEQLLNETATTR